MHDFQSDVRLLVDDSLPRGLHQDLADELLLAQMVDQDDGSECGDRQEMYVKQQKSYVAHRFHVMRETRRSRDEDVLQQEQSKGNEVWKTQILELVYEHAENVLRPSQNQRHAEFN